MTDYGRIHRDVAWFGIWASDTADDYGKRDASTVLAGAVEMCADEDMREDREVRGALEYLTRQGNEKRARAFMKALEVAHPDERRQAAQAALDAINRAIGLAWGKTPDRL